MCLIDGRTVLLQIEEYTKKLRFDEYVRIEVRGKNCVFFIYNVLQIGREGGLSETHGWVQRTSSSIVWFYVFLKSKL